MGGKSKKQEARIGTKNKNSTTRTTEMTDRRWTERAGQKETGSGAETRSSTTSLLQQQQRWKTPSGQTGLQEETSVVLIRQNFSEEKEYVVFMLQQQKGLSAHDT